ncbi:MAG: VTT domain-containing protein [bacterium]
MLELLKHFLDPVFLIQSLGLLGILGIVFAESGLFFGFFLPGDSLLFTAGLLASQGYFPIVTLYVSIFLAAVLGDSVGYAFGYRWGRKLFTKKESFFFRKEFLVRTEMFFEKYGSKALVLARFVPVVRTFTPILAGVGKMHYRKFLTYNLAGGFAWTTLLVFAGYYLGRLVPGVDKYIFPIILLIIVISFIPIVFEFLKNRKKGL